MKKQHSKSAIIKSKVSAQVNPSKSRVIKAHSQVKLQSLPSGQIVNKQPYIKTAQVSRYNNSNTLTLEPVFTQNTSHVHSKMITTQSKVNTAQSKVDSVHDLPSTRHQNDHNSNRNHQDHNSNRLKLDHPSTRQQMQRQSRPSTRQQLQKEVELTKQNTMLKQKCCQLQEMSIRDKQKIKNLIIRMNQLKQLNRSSKKAEPTAQPLSSSKPLQQRWQNSNSQTILKKNQTPFKGLQGTGCTHQCQERTKYLEAELYKERLARDRLELERRQWQQGRQLLKRQYGQLLQEIRDIRHEDQ